MQAAAAAAVGVRSDLHPPGASQTLSHRHLIQEPAVRPHACVFRTLHIGGSEMHPNHLSSSPILSTPPLPQHTLKYRGLGPGICDDVGEDGVESFAETGWVSSDSGKEDTESRRLCQQLQESAGAPILTPRGYAFPNHTKVPVATQEIQICKS